MISDLSDLCIGSNSSIRDAMACIDNSDAYIALVVDKRRRLLDTITDVERRPTLHR